MSQPGPSLCMFGSARSATSAQKHVSDACPNVHTGAMEMSRMANLTLIKERDIEMAARCRVVLIARLPDQCVR